MRRLAFILCVASCSNNSRNVNPNGGYDLTLPLQDDAAVSEDMSGEDLLMSFMPPDLLGIEAGNVYDLAVNADASGCAPGQMGTTCPSPTPAAAGCGPVEDCVIDGGPGNGLDDDCNGLVDDGCNCTSGSVQRCFTGPPGKRGVGACTDGLETCIGTEFGTWGPCVGAIGPSPEVCDGLDNDCDGCADDGLCCNGGVLCPAPNDPRIAPVAPFSSKTYMGTSFFSGTVTSWTWTVEGGPCDKLFASPGYTPAMNPPPQSYTVTGASSDTMTIFFTLSGDYTVTLTIVDDKGNTYTCKWVQHVVGPGVRFELCWDHQGDSSVGGADLDLHVHRPGTTTNWFTSSAPTLVDTTSPCPNNGKCTPPSRFTCDTSNNNCGGKHCCAQRVIAFNPDDCMWGNCTAGQYFTDAANTVFPNLYAGNPAPAWGDANSAIGICGGSLHGYLWSTMPPLGVCKNPRLDIDNILNVGTPENTNIDDPKNGDTFRAMVHYYGGTTGYIPCAQCAGLAGYSCDPGGSGFCVYSNSNTFTGGTYVKVEGSGASTTTIVEHPLVNIYCGGALKATFGAAPSQVTGFDFGVGNTGGEMWRVADVTAVVDAGGNTTDCTLKALHPPGSTSGYWVTPQSNTAITY